MADEAPKMTMTRLAEQVGEGMAALRADINQAAESAEVANKVNEELAKKVTTLQQEQKALAMLINGIKGAPGDAVRPSKIDNILARLEAVERNGTQDWTPLFEEHRKTLTEIIGGLKAVRERMDAVEDKTGVQPGGPFEQLTQDLEALKALVEQHGGLISSYGSATNVGSEEFDQLQAAVARLEHNPAPANDSDGWRQTIASDIRNLDSRVSSLATALGELAITPARIPGTAMATAVGGVHSKILQLMDEITSISKDREAKGGGIRYKFRGIEDAQNAVGAAMRKVRVLLRPEVVSWEHETTPVVVNDEKGQKTVLWATSLLTMRYTFVDPTDGSEFSIEMVGEGRDNSDKSASKAASMACKYALFQALMIPFEQVDESDGNHTVIEDRPQSRPTGDRPGHEPRVEPSSGGYNAAMDSSAMAGADSDDTLMQKAAQAAYYLRQATQQPAEVALPAIKRTMERVADLGIGEYKVDGVVLRALVATALHNVNAALEARARAATAQGMTRQGQQEGEGARALAEFEAGLAEPPSGYEGSEQEYNDALAALASPNVPEDVAATAMATVHAWESTH